MLPERSIIARLRRKRSQSREIILGIGDDCAILRPRGDEDLVVTTDLMLEGTHFRRDWHPAELVGHRCLARGLSDAAAMGARPLACFLSIGLPNNLPQKWLGGFLQGFQRLAARHNVPLAGGDTGESKQGIVADVTVLGAVQRGHAILRSGARPGDLVYVTGALGAAAAELRRLYAKKGLRATHFPQPRIAVAAHLRGLASAMIDISDGLSTDLAHICEESKVGATIVEPLIPTARGAALDDALHGGEDYELLFTAKPSAKVPLQIAGVPITQIGWITKEKKLRITDCKKAPRNLSIKGHQHFTDSRPHGSRSRGPDDRARISGLSSNCAKGRAKRPRRSSPPRWA